MEATAPGTAAVVTDEPLCESFIVQGKAPRSVIVVTVERAYYQCQKALVRSKLWDPESRVDRSTLPSAGQMAEVVTNGEIDALKYDAEYPEHMKRTIY